MDASGQRCEVADAGLRRPPVPVGDGVVELEPLRGPVGERERLVGQRQQRGPAHHRGRDVAVGRGELREVDHGLDPHLEPRDVADQLTQQGLGDDAGALHPCHSGAVADRVAVDVDGDLERGAVSGG